MKHALRSSNLKENKIANNEAPENQESDLKTNLRYLCDKEPSVSAVCRALKINRQQFSKYLNGTSIPSGKNLRKISEYFGQDKFTLTLPHIDFLSAINKKESTSFASPFMNLWRSTSINSSSDLEQYHGFYYVYCHSISFPGYISKSLALINNKGGVTRIKTIEIINKKNEKNGVNFSFKHLGEVSLLSDRVYIIEIESMLEKNIFTTMLFPCYQPKLRFINGISMGVSSTKGREPACRNIVYEFLGKTINIRHKMRECGLFLPNDVFIDDEVKNSLMDTPSPDKNIFFSKNNG